MELHNETDRQVCIESITFIKQYMMVNKQNKVTSGTKTLPVVFCPIPSINREDTSEDKS